MNLSTINPRCTLVAAAILTWFTALGIFPTLQQSVLAVGSASRQEVEDSRLNAWAFQLDADSYAARQKAALALENAGPKAIAALIDAWPEAGIEKRARIESILKFVANKIDHKKDRTSLELLKTARKSSDSKLRTLAVELIGPEPNPELVAELKGSIFKVVNGEEITVPISKELLTKLEDNKAFQLVRRAALRNTDRNTPWRTLRDSKAHQEILLYRVKWFNGQWSGWMLPGVNDLNEKLSRQYWNCFYDHEHEYLEIMTKIGELANRNDYLVGLKEQQRKQLDK